MNDLLKRFLSLALAIMMVVSYIPTSAFATEVECDHAKVSVVVTAPTCTEDGYTTYTCQADGCGHSYKNGTVAATGHSYADGACTVCGAADPEYVAPAPADAECSHNWGDTVAVTAPGCETVGSGTQTCTVEGCGETQTVEIAALGHSYAEVITAEATCTTAGSKTLTCTVEDCGDTKTEEIPATGHSYVDGACTVCGEAEAIEGQTLDDDGTTPPLTDDVAKIGDNYYATLADAVDAAEAMSGDVTVEIYAKVTLSHPLSGSYTSIKFVGKDMDAEIYLDVQGYITASGKKVAFEDLTLSKSNGEFITNAGFMNVAFGVYEVTEVTYTNCTFTNGAYASSGKVTYTGCTFYRSHDKYSLWAYGNADITVDKCTFADYRGIKMYAEGAAKVTNLTVKNSNFSAVNDKPAIVLTYGESVTLEGNTYSNTGVFELDLDGAPNGTTVTSDVALTCKNDNGACGVLVDGKIYTTVADAAKVATSGSTVTLLHNSTETVELAEGVTLNKNGYTAANVTVAVPETPAASGTITSCLVNLSDPAETFISSEITGLNATESVVIKLYSGETQIATTTLQKTEYFTTSPLGVKIIITGESSSWKTEWEEGMPRADVVPDKVVLFVDDQEMNSANVPMISTDGEATVNWADVPGVNPAPSAGPVEIDLSQGSYTITEAGEYIVSAYTGANTLTIKADATVTLKGVNITAEADASAVSIESGNVTLNVNADSTVTGGDNGAGIYVAEGAAVTVKGGKLTAIGNAGADDASGAAGIGGAYGKGASGKITIDGATVTAQGFGAWASGIGSASGYADDITITNGADVYAVGGYYANGAGTKLQSSYGKSDPEGGAAIGGGSKDGAGVGTITITDSSVKAFGGSKAAGIGAMFWNSVEAINIGGTSNVTAQGGSSSAGIGTSRAGDTGVSANIEISGGTVTATGGDYGAGIGAGYNADSLGNGADASALPETSITISGGTVTATGGEGGAAIGGGYKSDNVDIDITGGTVTATAGALVSGKTVENGGAPAAIGSGSNGSGVFENSPVAYIADTATVTVTAYEGGKFAVEGKTNEALAEMTNVTLTEIPLPATGKITPGYTSTEGKIWGEGGGNASESLVVKLYSGETLLATASLNNVDGIIDGDVYVTWNIPFADSTADKFWTVDWVADGYNINAMGTTVEMWIDGAKVAENNVQLNAADNLKKIVAMNATEDGTVQGCYTTLAAAVSGQDNDTAQIVVMRDVSEDLAGATISGKIVSGVEGGVTITNTDTNDYTYIEDLTIGSGVTFKALGAYFKDGASVIEGNLIVTEEGINSAEEAVLYQGYGSKVTVQNGGTVSVNGSLMIRYNNDKTAGLYIYGDNDDSTVELTVTRYYIGAYSGTFYAKDAVINANYILLDHEKEPDTYPVIELELDNSTVTTGSVTAVKDASINLTNGSALAVTGEFSAADTVKVTMDDTSSLGDVNGTMVASAEGLAEALNANKNVTLIADVDLTPVARSTGWVTVATYSGTLDGDGHTIKGLTAPLFNKITDATIQNLTIEANINTTKSDAAAIALMTGGTTNITNVTVKGTISGGTDVNNDLSKNGGAAGFIVRAAGNLTIDSCVNEAAVTGVDRKAAGFISSNGTASSGDVITIKNSVNNGAVTANRSNTTTNAYEVYAAGFMAWNGAKGITVNIENCTNNGAISGVRETEVEGYSTVAAGGIIGTCWNGAGITTTLTNVTNTGNVTATNNGPDHNAYAAGVIGLTNPSSNTTVVGATVSGTIKAVVKNKVGYATVGGVTAQTNNNNSVLTVNSADVSKATYVTEGGSAQYKGAVVGHHGGDDTSLTYTAENITAPAGMKMVGNAPITGLSGSGTETDPYLINNLEELKWFRDSVNTFAQDGSSQYTGKYIKLTADIDLDEDGDGFGEEWEPIGSTTADHGSFYGIFDGDGHTISNLVVSEHGTGSGFFAKTSGGGDGPQAVVKNITFNNVDVDAGDNASYAGGVIANAGGNTVVSNVHVTGYVYVNGYGYVGGIVGHGYPDLTDCHVKAEEGSYVHANYWCAGGIIGYAGEGGTPITNCSVSGLDIWSAYGGAAAVAGLLQDGNTLTNVSASNVEVTSASDYCMGYIAGNGEESTLTNVTVENVTATANSKAITVTDAVATIDAAIYFDLQSAISAGGEVKVLRDVTVSEVIKIEKDVTLDLNGHTVSLSQLKIASDINVEVKNGALVGTSADYDTIRSEVGNLTLTNVNVSGLRHTVRIKSGTATINGGTYTYGGTKTVYKTLNIINVGDDEAPTTNIANVTIKGGTFIAGKPYTYDGGSAVKVQKGSTVTIEGGSFSNGVLTTLNADDGATLSVTGGTYDQDPTAYAAEGYKAVKNEDGTYGVRELSHLIIVVSPVATMSTTITVATMDEAVAYAQANPADSVTYQITGPVEMTTGNSHGLVDLGNNVTIEGVTKEAKLTIVGGGVPDIKGVTFKNLTIADEGTYNATANEFMYQNFIDCSFENVVFEEGIRVSGDTTITGSTIHADKADQYAIWSDGGKLTMTETKIIVGAEGYGMVKSDAAGAEFILTGNTFEYLGEANKEALNVNGAKITASGNTFIDCTEGILPVDKTNYDAKGRTIADADVISAGNTVKTNAAKIGDVKYEDLLVALKAAQDGDTVTMLADVELYTRLIFSSYTNGRSVTLDGNGYRLYASSTNWSTGNGKHLINVNCDNVTLKNIVLDCNSIAEGANIYKAQNIVFDNVSVINKKGWNADLTVNGSTLTVKNKLAASYVDVDLGSGVTTTLGIVAEEGAVLEVTTLMIDTAAYPNTNLDKALATDGTSYYSFKKLDANGVLAGYSKSLSRLSNGYGYQLLEDATVSSNVILLNPGHTGTLDLNGHDLTVADGKTLTVNGDLTVSGTGTITGDLVLGNADATITGHDDLDVETSVTGAKVEYVDGKYVIVEAVASIGETYFYSLADAIEAAKAGDTITLLEDANLTEMIKIEKSITLDLNDKTVTSTAQKAFEVYANATIENGKIVAVQRCVDTRKAVTLTLNDVALEATKYSGYGNSQPLTIGGSEGGTVVAITDSTISAGDSGYGIISFVKTELTLTKSTVTAYGALYLKAGTAGSEIKLIESTLTCVDDASDGDPFAAVVFEDNSITLNVDANSAINAEKGIAIAFSHSKNLPAENPSTTAGNNVTVEGTINAGTLLSGWEADVAGFAVKAEYADQLKADGYVPEADDDGDGMIGIDAEAVAKIGDEVYADIDDALFDAASDETVVLLKDCISSDRITMINADTTLDLNGYMLTVSNIMAFGNIIDGKTGGDGGMIASGSRIILNERNQYLPLYDAANSCYRFFKYELVNKGYKAVSGVTNGVKFGIALYFDNTEAYTLLKDTANSGVKLVVEIDWTGKPENKTVLYTFEDELVQEFAGYGEEGTAAKYAMTVTVAGLDVLTAGNTISATPSVRSENTEFMTENDSINYVIPATE